MPIADSPARIREAERFGREILPAVSRTFALSVQLLRGDLGRSVLCAYLLCRIADTIEDDAHATPEDKARLLGEFLRGLDAAATADAFPALAAGIRGDAAHVQLLRRTDLLERRLQAGRQVSVRAQQELAFEVRADARDRDGLGHHATPCFAIRSFNTARSFFIAAAKAERFCAGAIGSFSRSKGGYSKCTDMGPVTLSSRTSLK